MCDVAARAGMQHKGMAQQQKDQMLRLTPEDFPTLSPAGYKVRTLACLRA
jgi:hypothetical protein